MKKIFNLWIAKETFDYVANVKQRLNYDDWVNFIDSNKNYFTWQEETEEGKETLANIEKVPEGFRERVIKGHSKHKALAEFNSKKGYYEVLISYNEELGIISTTFQKPVKKQHLNMLLDMAKRLQAYLLNNGTEIIDEKVLDTMG
ncbi:hypothetical protein JMN32_05820 [Fulvivirga sp. 29W222]|uniref:Uncharacterized protein n=1 Tax=Fulvivirga marina TaxID=2494733 RepID=A0A937FTW4_9BACT|nr:hypothetical protein [Fulvivirga marina]MBL6445814.1 hypothetical protein [Fulvivirga marina]